MWVLEPEQCAAIRKAAFALRVEQALSVLYNVDTVAQPLVAAIQTLLGRAIEAGLVAERPAFQFVRAAWVLGEAFDSKVPPIAALFADTGVEPAGKADRLARAIDLTLAALTQSTPLAPATASPAWGSVFLRAYESANDAEREAARAALVAASSGAANDQAVPTQNANLTAIVNALSLTVRVDQPSLG